MRLLRPQRSISTLRESGENRESGQSIDDYIHNDDRGGELTVERVRRNVHDNYPPDGFFV